MATGPSKRQEAVREQMIREAAYFRSQHRNPEHGKEVEDWLAAEQEIDEYLRSLRSLPREPPRMVL